MNNQIMDESAKRVNMSEDERSILRVMYGQGFRYIARDSIVSVSVFKNYPVNAALHGGYWWVGGSTADCFGKMFLFLKVEQPLEIKKLIDNAVVINLSNKKDDEL